MRRLLPPGRPAARRPRRAAALLVAIGLAAAPSALAEGDDDAAQWALEVTATAYNSLPGQTSGHPEIAAWGDRLEPGMKVIAVSRDLLKLGMRHGTVVEIEGLPGRYRVLDKLAKRWRRRIDLYMGEDVEAAREWGRRKVWIRWTPARPRAGEEAP